LNDRQGPIEEAKLPQKSQEKEAWIAAVTVDGNYLLSSIYTSETHRWLWQTPPVRVLWQVWMQQFYYVEGKLALRDIKDLPPASIRIDSLYDPEAHYSQKRSTEWVGFKMHVTETCDDDMPHLITHVETTIAPQSDADMTEPIHEALAAKDCLPDRHLADAGYVDAEQLVESQAPRTMPVNLESDIYPIKLGTFAPIPVCCLLYAMGNGAKKWVPALLPTLLIPA
jgi:transposase